MPRLALLALLACTAVACQDSTSPRVPLAVAIEGAPLSVSVDFDEDGAYVNCDVLLTATATGTAGDRAEWLDGVLQVYGGRDLNILLGHLLLPSTEVQELWRVPLISSGESQVTRWLLQARSPFKIKGRINYLADGAATPATSRFEFHCHTEGFEAEGMIWIQFPRLTPDQGEIEPGQVLGVHYRAGSVADLKYTEIRIASGTSVQVIRYNDTSTKDIYRAVPIVLTGQLELDHQIQVQIAAVDIYDNQVESEWVPGPMLVDRTPPSVLALCLVRQPTELCRDTTRSVASYAEDEAILARVELFENHLVSEVVYELGPPFNHRDSVQVGEGGRTSALLQFRGPEGSVGSSTLTVFARDMAGLESPPVPLPVHIYGVNQRVIRDAAVPGPYPYSVLDDRRDRLFLASEQGTVSMISLSTLHVTKLAELSSRVSDIDISPDGASLAVALPDNRTIHVIDVAGLTSAPWTLRMTEGNRPKLLRYTADGRLMVLAVDTVARASMVEVDPITGSEKIRTPIQWEPGPAAARASDYSRTAFFTSRECVVAYESSSDTIGPCHLTTLFGQASATATGTRFLRGMTIHNHDLSLLRPLDLGNDTPTGISHDGENFFQAHERGLLRVAVDPNLPMELIPLPPSPLRAIHASADGAYLVTVQSDSSDAPERTAVSVVELN